MRQTISLTLLGLVFACGATERINLDADWRFSREGEAVRTVSVPHDWSIEAAPKDGASNGKEWGFYPSGKATYEKRFVLTEEDLAKELELVFDGVLRAAKVSVNGGEPVTQVIRQLATVVSFGISNAAAILIGKAIGEKKEELAKVYSKRLVGMTLIFGVFGAAIILLLSQIIPMKMIRL